MCGYVPPAQNSFKPNIMTPYIHEKTGEVIVANDNVEKLDVPNKGIYIREDLYKKPVVQQTQQKQQLPPPPATVAQTLIPARPIPATAIKTPEEVAATPKAAITATETKSDIVTP